MKVTQNKRLHCKLENSREEHTDYLTSSPSVMTCGDKVVSNVKEALIGDVMEGSDKIKLSEQPMVNAQDDLPENKGQLYETCRNRWVNCEYISYSDKARV